MISFLDLALSQPLVEYSPPGGPGYGQGVLIVSFAAGLAKLESDGMLW